MTGWKKCKIQWNNPTPSDFGIETSDIHLKSDLWGYVDCVTDLIWYGLVDQNQSLC